MGTVITTITANDVDTNPTLTYDFADGGNPDRMFSIDRFSGKITLAQPLDHERQQQYTLRVQASDMAHITETSITVNVLDENDNAPVFSVQNYHASLPGKSRCWTIIIHSFLFIYHATHSREFDLRFRRIDRTRLRRTEHQRHRRRQGRKRPCSLQSGHLAD